MKYKVLLTIKAMMLTVFVFIFVAAFFVILNEGRSKLYGDGVSVYLNHDALIFRRGEKEVLVQPNKKEVGKLLDFCYNHPYSIPYPFNLMVISKRLASLIEK